MAATKKKPTAPAEVFDVADERARVVRFYLSTVAVLEGVLAQAQSNPGTTSAAQIEVMLKSLKVLPDLILSVSRLSKPQPVVADPGRLPFTPPPGRPGIRKSLGIPGESVEQLPFPLPSVFNYRKEDSNGN